jgi:hypothetical protein
VGTVVLSSTDSRTTGLPASYTFTAGDAGSHTFSNVVLETAGTQTIAAADSANRSVVGSATVIVMGLPATQLVFTTPPPSPIVSGQKFTVVVSAKDSYDNVDTTYDKDVSITLPGQSSSLTVQAQNGVATFSELSVDMSAQGGSIQVSGGGLPTLVSGSITVSSGSGNNGNNGGSVSNAQVPTITSEQVVISRKTNKKGKLVGKPVLVGFTLQYSTAMNSGTAGSSANYTVSSATTKRVKNKKVTVFKPVGFTASYDAVKHTVALTLSGKQTFATGGQITVVYAPPGGVSSQDGIALDPADATFTIQKKASSVTLG